MWSPFAELAPGGEDEAHGADPGKDLFALLALTFLVISVILMLASHSAEAPLPVDTAAPGNAEQAQALSNLPPAVIRGVEEGVEVAQGGRVWKLPAQAAAVAREAALGEIPGKPSVLIVDPPSGDLSASQLVLAVQVLNAAGVRVRFRAVAGNDGRAQ